jgi:diaminopimelate decarboxylase
MTTVQDTTVTTIAAGLSVWPASTAEPGPGDLAVGGVSLAEVADPFGIPVYVPG